MRCCWLLLTASETSQPKPHQGRGRHASRGSLAWTAPHLEAMLRRAAMELGQAWGIFAPGTTRYVLREREGRHTGEVTTDVWTDVWTEESRWDAIQLRWGSRREGGTAMTNLMEFVTEFRFPVYPEGHEFWDIAAEAVMVVKRGPDRWAVVSSRGWCHDVTGHGEYESIPSERSDEFKARYRFGRDEAVRIAREVVVPAERARWDRLLAGKGTGS